MKPAVCPCWEANALEGISRFDEEAGPCFIFQDGLIVLNDAGGSDQKGYIYSVSSDPPSCKIEQNNGDDSPPPPGGLESFSATNLTTEQVDACREHIQNTIASKPCDSSGG